MKPLVKTTLVKTSLALTLMYASFAQAHTPVCVCKQQAGQITCEGGYHDGSRAQGVRIDVIAYDETILFTGKLDARSRFAFAMPSQPFYVLMDVGPGEMAEIDWKDIVGIDATAWKKSADVTPVPK
ncbi:MAG: hypothetical protein QM808_12495 [Steroidobacteraceae bacterium]